LSAAGDPLERLALVLVWEAIAGDRNRAQKHVTRARIIGSSWFRPIG
jgi:hypothetical protein